MPNAEGPCANAQPLPVRSGISVGRRIALWRTTYAPESRRHEPPSIRGGHSHHSVWQTLSTPVTPPGHQQGLFLEAQSGGTSGAGGLIDQSQAIVARAARARRTSLDTDPALGLRGPSSFDVALVTWSVVTMPSSSSDARWLRSLSTLAVR